MMKQSTEDYLKAISKLMPKKGQVSVRVGKIAEKLGISRPAVTEMMKKLESAGYLKHQPYKGVALTTQGRQIGARMIRRHRLWEMYLFQELGLPWEKVHEEAERLEHACSDFLVDRLEEKLGFPQFDPHGNPIPDKSGQFPEIHNEKALLELAVGESGEVSRVVNFDRQFLTYLESIGIQLGQLITVSDILTFDESFVVSIEGETANLSRQVVSQIYVKVKHA